MTDQAPSSPSFNPILTEHEAKSAHHPAAEPGLLTSSNSDSNGNSGGSSSTSPHTASTNNPSPSAITSGSDPTTTATPSQKDINSNSNTTTSSVAPTFTGMAANTTSTASNMAASVASTAASAAVGVKDNVFSMFGGGPKKEGKSVAKDDEVENDRSGSSKAKAAEAKEADKEKDGKEKDDEAVDVEAEPEHHFEPVVHLTEQVAVVTGEENHEVVHKIRAKMFKFDTDTTEWKERGVGELKLLKSNETRKTKLVMRRDKTWKVCATHYVTALAPLDANVGSDRSWVYTAYYDVSEGMDPTKGVTIAMRFANKDAALDFKKAYEKYGAENDALKGSTTAHGTSTSHEATKAEAGETHQSEETKTADAAAA